MPEAIESFIRMPMSFFNDDVSKLESNFANELAGMVQEGFCSNRCEREKHVLCKHGKKLSDPYFNAGVCVMNSKKRFWIMIFTKRLLISSEMILHTLQFMTRQF